ncbi:IspD/TarI family cytidylyltransferase [Salinactinospora qingdaonensis]|uniref:2-C-methyl-D-erythritol 4-phosphate cytidylyltransferase n=1 Tax=Salinactinospora qingdaonensis TaxID=702744 RepID=A0ABP7FZ81_9ACTN
MTTGVPYARRPKVTAAVLAGGVGARMGGSRPKQLLPLAGRTVIEHTITAFCAAPDVDDVVVCMVPDHVETVETLVAERGLAKVSQVVPGGQNRTATSLAALAALSPAGDDELVLLHDAVRPLVSPETIQACVDALSSAGAVGVAVPATDTVVQAAPGPAESEVIRDVPPRAWLRCMQTPQGFRLGVIRRAYERAMRDPDLVATDDCGVVLRYLPEEEVHLVPGDEANLKVTHPGDLEIAEALLRVRTRTAKANKEGV